MPYYQCTKHPRTSQAERVDRPGYHFRPKRFSASPWVHRWAFTGGRNASDARLLQSARAIKRWHGGAVCTSRRTQSGYLRYQPTIRTRIASSRRPDQRRISLEAAPYLGPADPLRPSRAPRMPQSRGLCPMLPRCCPRDSVCPRPRADRPHGLRAAIHIRELKGQIIQHLCNPRLPLRSL